MTTNNWLLTISIEDIEAPVSDIEEYEGDREHHPGVLVNHIDVLDFWQRWFNHSGTFLELIEETSTFFILPGVTVATTPHWKWIISMHSKTWRKTLVRSWKYFDKNYKNIFQFVTSRILIILLFVSISETWYWRHPHLLQFNDLLAPGVTSLLITLLHGCFGHQQLFLLLLILTNRWELESNEKIKSYIALCKTCAQPT